MMGYSAVPGLGASSADLEAVEGPFRGRRRTATAGRNAPLSGVRDADGHFYFRFDLQRPEHGGEWLDAELALI